MTCSKRLLSFVSLAGSQSFVITIVKTRSVFRPVLPLIPHHTHPPCHHTSTMSPHIHHVTHTSTMSPIHPPCHPHIYHVTTHPPCHPHIHHVTHTSTMSPTHLPCHHTSTMSPHIHHVTTHPPCHPHTPHIGCFVTMWPASAWIWSEVQR